MARAIRHRPSADTTTTALPEPPGARAGSTDPLATLAEVVRLLDERGFLRFAEDLLREEERVVEVLVDRVPPQDVRAAWKAITVLVTSLRQVEPATVARLSRSVAESIEEAERAARTPMVGFFDVIAALNDPDVNRGVRMLLGALRGLGRGAAP